VRKVVEAAGVGYTDTVPELRGTVGDTLLSPKRIDVSAVRAVLRRGWPVPPVFGWLQRLGGIAPGETDAVFNMGVGFCVVCRPPFADSAVKQLEGEGVAAWRIGEIVAGEAGGRLLDPAGVIAGTRPARRR
jgi:phosphoribosylformylglycinamidine cyclo-ligase